MNPNAKPFVFNPGATSWTPPAPPTAEQSSNIAPGLSAPAEQTTQIEEEVVKQTEQLSLSEEKIAGGNETENAENGKDEDDEALDENDPLWIATLKVCNGDRAAALRMLDDPDSLMKYPEIVAAMESSEEAGSNSNVADDWETAQDNSKKESVDKSDVNNSYDDEDDDDDDDEDYDDYDEDDDEDAEDKGTDKSSKKGKKSGKTKKSKKEKDAEEEEEEEVEDPREHMNIVFIGHVDAGKSTLSGSILYLMGKVDARTIERFEKEAKNRNRESWFLAFIMDTSEEERAKGKTVEVGRAVFETENNRYTILDAPGHKNYVPNMISGAAQADIGVLVISARRGEFETGFEKGGQTREHALLAKTLGVRFLVVVINKMDDHTVAWSKERYENCVTKLKPYLKSCGYAIKRDVRFVPISGLTGDNILKEVSEERCSWWKKYCEEGAHNTTTPTLISTLDSFKIADRNPDAPLRVPCLDRYSERGCVMIGKVESGTLRTGDKVAILPTKKTSTVEAMYSDEKKIRVAKPGENVLVKFNLSVDDIQKGFVISSISRPCHTTTDFVAQLAIIDMPDGRPIFTSGYDCILHIHTAEIEVTCITLLSVSDRKGNETKKRFASQGEMCMAHLQIPLSTCMEPYANMPSLGRITLRDEQRTIAIGKVIKLLKKKSNSN